MLATDPDLRLREIADIVGISERRTHGIVTDLTRSGYLLKQREGRRNRYEIRTDRPLHDDLAEHRTVGDLLALLARSENPGGGGP